jgi:hypothetical protein
MNAQQNFAFAELVRAWDRREVARMAGDIRALSDARMRLDAERAHMRSTLGIR